MKLIFTEIPTNKLETMITPNELLSAKRLEISNIESQIEKIQSAKYRSDDVVKHFHLGMVGGSGKNTVRLNRQRERELDKVIENSKKITELEDKKKAILIEIGKLESGTWKSKEQLRDERNAAKIKAKQKDKDKRSNMSAKERLFIGQYPGGTVYADRAIEQHGDYKKIAFKSKSTGEVTWYAKRINPEMKQLIESDILK